MKVTVNIKKSVEQNAQEYFEKAKKQRKKLDGARKALEISLKKREDLVAKGEEKLEKAKQQQKEKELKSKVKKEWFENFRWFYSSEGFLVIGGRDATTNEIVIKKHTEPKDIVFHTDMAGSPFFVIKVSSQGGKGPGESTLKEVADATLAFSRAWKMGLQTTPTFWVKPDQVTKEANTGEYLPKGAFMIRGKTNYMTTDPTCAIGLMKDIHKDKLMCAPISAIKAHCDKFIEIVQGNSKPSDIARTIKRKFGGELDEIIRLLPSGSMDIKE